MKSLLIKIVVIACAVGIISLLIAKIAKLNKELDEATNNIKAYASENSTLSESNKAFRMSMDQLKFFNDSLMLAMKKVANDNGVKDRRIKALQYQLEHFSKQDTIILRDTIFKDPGFILDTCIEDKWNKSCLHLEYPGIIQLENEYNNEKFVTLDTHKEPVKPRKWFLTRWFTRKHMVVEVIIVDQNPYVTTKKQRYINIID